MTTIIKFGAPPEPEKETNEDRSLDEEIFKGIRRLKTLRDWTGIKFVKLNQLL